MQMDGQRVYLRNFTGYGLMFDDHLPQLKGFYGSSYIARERSPYNPRKAPRIQAHSPIQRAATNPLASKSTLLLQ